jgi:hypothetical protein
MEDLDGLWKRLSLNDKEDNLFDLSSDSQPDKPTLAAKFYTRRVINVEAIARTFKPLWQTRKSFSIQDVGDNMVLIEFEEAADLERVLLGEPWSYDKYLIAFHRLSNEVAVENLPFHLVDFWVQLHNLPVLSMKRKVAVAMGSYIGEVLPSPNQEEEAVNGKYLRVRVRVDITKPLCHGRKISLGNGAEDWVSFQYERLPNFCYWCGTPTHGERDCEDWLSTPANLREKPMEYGTWLRAAGERAPRRVQITVEGSNRRPTGSRWKPDAPTKPTPPPYQPPAASHPCADFFASDMEVSENLVPDQNRADIPVPNPVSFEERLQAIDVEINYVSENHGDFLPAGNSHIEPIQAAETHANYLSQPNLPNPPNPSRAPLNNISNQWASPAIVGKPKTGSWKKKARSKEPITPTSPIILAEKRTSAEAFQAGPAEARQTKTARLFQNELLSVEAGTQPHRLQ